MSQRRRPARARHRGEPLQETGRDGRGAGELGGTGQDHLARAQHLGEVVSRKSDASLRQIEPEREPHRPAQPGIAARFRRPGAFVQSAEHEAIAGGQPRFQSPENAHPHPRQPGPPHHAVRDGGGEQVRIVGERNRKIGRRQAGRNGIEDLGKRVPIRARKGRRGAAAIVGQRGDDLAVAGRDRAEGMRAARQALERRQRGRKP